MRSGHPNRAGWFQGGDAECFPVPPPRDRPYRLILLGPPGVGKGTQATMLCEQLQTCHLSTGDLFRAVQCGTQASPAMMDALNAMRRGELVSDDIVMSLVQERSPCLRCQGGFLLDGFPRTLRQAEMLEELLAQLGVSLDAVLCYEMPLEEIVERLGGRRTCTSCRAVFHLQARPPINPDRCDQCDGELVQRDDDRPEAIRVRMRAYEEGTKPLTDFYERTGKLLRITACGTPEQIFEGTMRAMYQQFAAA